MTSYPLISVLVPVYDGEKYLSETLDSIVSQDYRNLEIILLDDGSSDRTLSIMESFSAIDSRVKVVSRERGGVGKARNTLLEMAEGQLVLFVDGDDILSSPSFVSSLYERKEKYGAQAVSARTLSFRKTPRKGKRKEKDRIYSGKDFARMMTKPMGYFCFSHSRLMEKSLFPPSPFPMDMIFEDVVAMPWILYSAKKVVYAEDVTYHYRMNRQGLSHSPLSPSSLDEMEAYWMNYSRAKDIGDRRIVVDSAVFFLTKYYYFSFMLKKFSLKRKEYVSRFGKRKNEAWASLLRGGKG